MDLTLDLAFRCDSGGKAKFVVSKAREGQGWGASVAVVTAMEWGLSNMVLVCLLRDLFFMKIEGEGGW
jgi:hypothetical protein